MIFVLPPVADTIIGPWQLVDGMHCSANALNVFHLIRSPGTASTQMVNSVTDDEPIGKGNGMPPPPPPGSQLLVLPTSHTISPEGEILRKGVYNGDEIAMVMESLIRELKLLIFMTPSNLK